MSYADLVPRVRKALGVSAAYDAETVLPGVRAAARHMLRKWNFPRSKVEAIFTPLALGQQSIELPASGVGKIGYVRLWDRRTSTHLYKDLRRSEGMVGAQEDGPSIWWQQALGISIDTALPEAGLELRVGYQTLDPALAEGWLSSDYEDALYYRAVYALASDVRKPEVQQAYSTLWGEQLTDLSVYLNELEWAGVDMKMEQEEPVYAEGALNRYGQSGGYYVG